MGLTPVPVRGKRARPLTMPPQALQHLAPETVSLSTHGASQEQDQELQAPTEKSKRSLQSVVAERASKRRSNLDTLPSEILEQILLYSANLALPHASPTIGLRLSERATLIRFFIWAFHDTWDQWFGMPTSRTLLHGPPLLAKHKAPCEGDPVLQSAVLAQPWAKTDFILQAQQTWADHHAQGRWFQHSVPWYDEVEDVGHALGGPMHFNARDCFEVDYQQALKWPPFQAESMPWGGQDIHVKTRIPDRLITGPWTEESQRRLFWLTRGGALVDMHRHPWETKLDFLHNAIIEVTEPNMIAINCLMGSWVFKDLPGEVVRKEIADIGRRIQWGDDSESVRTVLQRTSNALTMYHDMGMRRSSV